MILISLMLIMASSESNLTEKQSKIVNQAVIDNQRLCDNRWPDDFAMKKYCRDQAREGFIDFIFMFNKSPEKLKKALTKCYVDWFDKKANAIDWAMAAFCANQQRDAYYDP